MTTEEQKARACIAFEKWVARIEGGYDECLDDESYKTIIATLAPAEVKQPDRKKIISDQPMGRALDEKLAFEGELSTAKNMQKIKKALEDEVTQPAQEPVALKPGDAYLYTNSNALGFVRLVGINPHTGSIVVTNEAAPDKHLRQVAGWDHLQRVRDRDIEPPATSTAYLLKLSNTPPAPASDALLAALRDIRDNYDHDNDAHKYGTHCRVCVADEAIQQHLADNKPSPTIHNETCDQQDTNKLNPDMPTQELLLHMGELTRNEIRVARAAIRWANTRK